MGEDRKNVKPEDFWQYMTQMEVSQRRGSKSIWKMPMFMKNISLSTAGSNWRRIPWKDKRWHVPPEKKNFGIKGKLRRKKLCSLF